MHQRKSKKILIYFFLFLLIGSINNYSINKTEFYKIKNISIKGLGDFENSKILKEIKKLDLDNILFLKSNEFSKIIEKNSLILNYKIFKKYPSSLEIKLEKTEFLARINKNGKMFLVGSNGKLIKSDSINKLPFIFGQPEIEDFLKFKKIIDDSRIKYKKIKNLYFFQSNRWDIELDNNIIIKLSNKNLSESLEAAFIFLNNSNLNDLKIIDVRIQNQIIVNE